MLRWLATDINSNCYTLGVLLLMVSQRISLELYRFCKRRGMSRSCSVISSGKEQGRRERGRVPGQLLDAAPCLTLIPEVHNWKNFVNSLRWLDEGKLSGGGQEVTRKIFGAKPSTLA